MSSVLPADYEVTIASFATSSSGLNINRSWTSVYLMIPTMTSNTELYINGSVDGTTYRQIYNPQQNSVNPVGTRFLINSAVTNAFVPIPNGFKYIKVEASAVISFTAAFRIICSD